MRYYLLLILFLFVFNVTFSQCLVNANSNAGSEMSSHYINSSGSVELDTYLENELKSMERFFNITVEFHYVEDPVINAFASSERDNANSDGTIYLLTGLINSLNKDKAKLKMVLAHECGHIAQYKYGRLSNLNKPYWEIFADLLSGSYLSMDNLMSNKLFISSISATAKYGDTDYFSEGHHGTPEERSKATFIGGMINGYGIHHKYNIPPYSIDEIYDIGVTFVKRQSQMRSGNNLLSSEPIVVCTEIILKKAGLK